MSTSLIYVAARLTLAPLWSAKPTSRAINPSDVTKWQRWRLVFPLACSGMIGASISLQQDLTLKWTTGRENRKSPRTAVCLWTFCPRTFIDFSPFHLTGNAPRYIWGSRIARRRLFSSTPLTIYALIHLLICWLMTGAAEKLGFLWFK